MNIKKKILSALSIFLLAIATSIYGMEEGRSVKRQKLEQDCPHASEYVYDLRVLFSNLPLDTQKDVLSFLPDYAVVLRCNKIDDSARNHLKELGFSCKQEGDSWILQSLSQQEAISAVNNKLAISLIKKTDKLMLEDRNEQQKVAEEELHKDIYYALSVLIRSYKDKDSVYAVHAVDFIKKVSNCDPLFLNQIVMTVPMTQGGGVDLANEGYNLDIARTFFLNEYVFFRKVKQLIVNDSHTRLAVILGVVGLQNNNGNWQQKFILHVQPTKDGLYKNITQDDLQNGPITSFKELLQNLRSISWDEGPFTDIAFSSDGHYIAVQKKDGSLRVYNWGSIEDGDCKADLQKILCGKDEKKE